MVKSFVAIVLASVILGAGTSTASAVIAPPQAAMVIAPPQKSEGVIIGLSVIGTTPSGISILIEGLIVSPGDTVLPPNPITPASFQHD